MLVYGDRSERADPRRILGSIAEELDTVAGLPPGLARHAALVSCLIEAGRLLQGVADAGFHRTGEDRAEPVSQLLASFVLGIALGVRRSWDSGFRAELLLPAVPAVAGLPDDVELRQPEGYAFYSLYPEAYADAARSLRLDAPPCVIGLRSISTSLAAMVAAALDAPTFYTVRPSGDPFARKLLIASDLSRALLERDAHYVVVDEGPGQSGSSFGAVADWLMARKVPLDRIAFVPSHAGSPGPQASAAHRQLWQTVQRAPADLGGQLEQLLPSWLAETLGPLDGSLIDISGGRWREQLYPASADWPAVHAALERRKFIARASGRSWLVKFAGLGATGERKLERARGLAKAGWGAEPHSLVHGFLVEPWHADARPSTPLSISVSQIGSYLGIRARLFGAPEDSGASLRDLLTMCRRNAGVALGEDAAAALACWEHRLASLEQKMVRVATDNRLEPHEWLELNNGRVLKADALDHCAAHDLVGCQDIAWDVAGAAVEFDLDQRACAELAAAVGRSCQRLVDPELLSFYMTAYLAFRTGLATMAAQAAPNQDERCRCERQLTQYRDKLQVVLQLDRTAATRRNLPLDKQVERTGAGTILAQ